MELEILKLFYDYSINGKLVDPNFIDKLIEIVVSNKKLNDYIRTVEFTNRLDKSDYAVQCASYSYSSKKILIDYESIQQFMVNEIQCYGHLFIPFEQIMFNNLTIVQIILHELEHAYQYKQADDKNDNSLENKIIHACFRVNLALQNPKFLEGVTEKELNIYLQHTREQYKKYYIFKPTERLAQYHSYKTILEAIKQIQNLIPNLYEFNNALFAEEMIKGYRESIKDYNCTCPTEVYLAQNNIYETWKGFDFYKEDSQQILQEVSKEYSLSKRVSLGLPISNEEYGTTISFLNSTNKYNC